LLAVNKPAGWNTHAPSPYTGEGVYDWLRHRAPSWADLAIIHRLDKETSGVLVFGKTPAANRSLTEQFTQRVVRKRYVFLTHAAAPGSGLNVVSTIERAGERYVSRPWRPGAERAETRFRRLKVEAGSGFSLMEACPLTGRTHQIRVHAAANGFPVLGDTLYGGSRWPRVCLHAAELTFHHPVGGKEMTVSAEPNFAGDDGRSLRAAVIDPEETDAWRMIHGAADGRPGWYVDKLGSCALSQSERPLDRTQQALLASWPGIRSVYHKRLDRQVRRAAKTDSSPQWIAGELAPVPLVIRENGVRFEMSFGDGYSVGLFLDQRDNRRRLLANHIAARFPAFDGGAAGREILNTFAYTCGFSVCAARAGARTTSLDLSRKYLEWGRRNFQLNGIAPDPETHAFIYGEVINWLTRWARKNRVFDAVLLDPPTFSQSKESGLFRAEKDYGKLVAQALTVLRRPGLLFASTNAAGLTPPDFVALVEQAAVRAGRAVVQRHYAPQPPDFPVHRAEPAYLKTLWLRLE
jgi:23S rRNA (cytosine1962-C5)-methyltransferase